LDKVSANTSYSDFGPSYLNDQVVFASSVPGNQGEDIHKWNDQPFTDLYVADVNVDGDLFNPRPLLGDVNTRYHETSPTFTKDGKTMYFTRNNFNDGKKGKDQDKTLKLKIYKATNNGDGNWTNVIELPFNNKEYSSAHPALSPDEKRLYFVSERPGGIGLSDLWYVDILENDAFSEPKNLGNKINTEARESFPFISENNNLYFSSDGRSGYGGYDVFKVAINENGELGNTTNLGEPTNGPMDDFGFIMDESKRLGYMTSNREGNEGSINDDIYIVREQCDITLSGNVFDVDTEELLPGAVVTISDENNEVLDTMQVGADAQFSFTAECEQKYTIRATKEGYGPFERFVQTENKTAVIDIPVPLESLDPCPPNDLGCRLTLLPIYFDLDKSNSRPDAAVELAKILVAMQEYPSLVIHIESHTDSRATNAYNMQLSNRRALSTMNWLINKGVDATRLSAQGYGEERLTNNCSDGVPCTEENHQLNRRSMFIIQN
jgi:outer membrane protein OmpA-like peptidoglycan-associated protein